MLCEWMQVERKEKYIEVISRDTSLSEEKMMITCFILMFNVCGKYYAYISLYERVIITEEWTDEEYVYSSQTVWFYTLT